MVEVSEKQNINEGDEKQYVKRKKALFDLPLVYLEILPSAWVNGVLD